MSKDKAIQNLITQAQQAADEAPKAEQRITVILHPNSSRISVALNDRVFNHETYSFNRNREAAGAEKELLHTLNNKIVGIHKAETGKNILHLELSDGMRLREFIPQVVTALLKWGMEGDPDYAPVLYCENRRWAVEPIDGEFHTIQPGVKEGPTVPDLGVPYQVWIDGS